MAWVPIGHLAGFLASCRGFLAWCRAQTPSAFSFYRLRETRSRSRCVSKVNAWCGSSLRLSRSWWHSNPNIPMPSLLWGTQKWVRKKASRKKSKLFSRPQSFFFLLLFCGILRRRGDMIWLCFLLKVIQLWNLHFEISPGSKLSCLEILCVFPQHI